MRSTVSGLIHVFFGKFPQERRLFIVIIFAAFCLIARWALGIASLDFFKNASESAVAISTGLVEFTGSQTSNLPQMFIWACIQFGCFFLLPALFLLLFRPKSFDILKFPEKAEEWKPYGILFLVMIVPLIFVSQMESFKSTYPFLNFGQAGFNLNAFLFWELLYALQFVAIEFFFRGFLLIAMLPVLGEAALAVSVLPYVMIHFGKPMPEVFGAAIAGWVLARLAFKTGSIVPGILLHYAIALSMDLLAL
jgi:uncharacterized protein